MQVQLQVNGKAVTINAAPHTLLVQALRDNLKLTGTHVGCDTAQCGVCTVLMDGKAVKSCNMLLAQAAGTDIETIEGLTQGGRMGRLQQAFHENLGTQCGFCTPGMVMASEALLRREPHPDEAQIREALAGNLCR